jgi:pimeloyl-ACP methyl ester carboxylesterase
LWASSWAAAHPNRVAGIAAIYPAFDLRTYPGLDRAASAYQLTPEQLSQQLERHNPIARGRVLAEARIPVFIIHGEIDNVVPIRENSLALRDLYAKHDAGDRFTIEVIADQGHNHWPGFFRCEPLVEFAITQARTGMHQPNE